MSIEIDVDRDLCIGSATCVRLAPGAFALDDEEIATIQDAKPSASTSCGSPPARVPRGRSRSPAGRVTSVPDLGAAAGVGSAELASAPGDGRHETLAAHNLVDGAWVPAAGGGTFERRNPASPDEVLGPFPDSGPRDVETAVLAARAACAGWAGRPGAERAAILQAAAGLANERAEGIAHVITRETGKPLREARGEAARVATTLRYTSPGASTARAGGRRIVWDSDETVRDAEIVVRAAAAGHG